ncbi:MAG: AI-2E family transporter [Thermodesulfobacteriota bacterium]
MKKLFLEWIKKYLSDPQVIILGLLLILGFVTILLLGKMLLPVFAGIVIAFLLDGFVAYLVRIHIPRRIAVGVVFLAFLICLVVLLLGFLPLLIGQIRQMLQQLPSMIAGIQKALLLLPERYPDFISEAQIRNIITFLSSELTSAGQRLLSLSLASVRGVISVIVYLVLVPFLVFFFLKDKAPILRWLSSFLPENRGLATEVWDDVNQQIGNYIRGKIWEIIIIWAVSYLIFLALKLKFAMLLAFFVGLSVLIPYIGAAAMYMPVALVAYFQWGLSAEFVYALIAYSIIQLLDGNLLAPLLLSGVVNLHPVAIVSAVLVFGGLWGFWGFIFAVPLANLVHAVIKAFFARKHDREKEV